MNTTNYIDMYCSFLLNVRRLSDNTVKRNHTVVKDFFATVGKDLSYLTIDDVYSYIEIIQKRKRTAFSRYGYKGEGFFTSKTIESLVGCTKGFLERCYSYKFINFDPKYLKKPKVTNEEDIEPLEGYEVDLLLRAPREAHEREDVYLRDTLLFEVGYRMGLRAEEALGLTFEELTGEVLRIVGKGRKKRFITIPFHIQEMAKEYQKLRNGKFTIEQTYDYQGSVRTRTYTGIDRNPNMVFTSLSNTSYGQKLRRDSVSDLFRFYEKFCGIKKRITYHLLRHAFATFLHDAGVDEETIKQLGGWCHSTTMSRYIHVSEQKMREAQSKMQVIRFIPQRI